MMESLETLMLGTALASWNQVIERVTKRMGSLSNSELQKKVAPNRNTAFYLLGHLTVANDRMLPLLRIGDRVHPELNEAFFDNPDGSVEHPFRASDLRTAWATVNAKLLEEMARLSPTEWLERHASVDESGFAANPLRNRLAILLSRTNHASFHLGQLILI